MSYKEKSVLGIAFTVLVVMGWFFSQAFSMLEGGDPRPGALLWLSIPVVIATIVLEVLIEAVLGVVHRDDAGEDERDRLFDLRGERTASYVLHIGVYFAIGHLMINDLMDQLDDAALFVSVMLFFGAVTLATLAKCGTQVFAYRRGY